MRGSLCPSALNRSVPPRKPSSNALSRAVCSYPASRIAASWLAIRSRSARISSPRAPDPSIHCPMSSRPTWQLASSRDQHAGRPRSGGSMPDRAGSRRARRPLRIPVRKPVTECAVTFYLLVPASRITASQLIAPTALDSRVTRSHVGSPRGQRVTRTGASGRRLLDSAAHVRVPRSTPARPSPASLARSTATAR